jgi:hypothetical protein
MLAIGGRLAARPGRLASHDPSRKLIETVAIGSEPTRTWWKPGRMPLRSRHDVSRARACDDQDALQISAGFSLVTRLVSSFDTADGDNFQDESLRRLYNGSFEMEITNEKTCLICQRRLVVARWSCTNSSTASEGRRKTHALNWSSGVNWYQTRSEDARVGIRPGLGSTPTDSMLSGLYLFGLSHTFGIHCTIRFQPC